MKNSTHTDLTKDTNPVAIDIPQCNATVRRSRDNEEPLTPLKYLQCVDLVLVGLELGLDGWRRKPMQRGNSVQ